jgi:molecular chaperone IbpA
MTTIDFTPLYRSSVGFDRLASLLDSAMRSDQPTAGYPPYDIEVLEEDRYAITLAVAGFDRSELDIQVERGVLSVRGRKQAREEQRNYLYQGIANRAFERKFNLADYVEVTGAEFTNGLLTISLRKVIPEAMKPRTIEIGESSAAIEHSRQDDQAA